MNFVDQIYDFNQQAGLISNGYSDLLESSFQIEEALEGFDISEMSVAVSDYRFKTDSAKDLARYILVGEAFLDPAGISDVDRLDKACDAIVFAFGSIFKLGLNQEQAAKAVSIVMSANLTKLSMPKDEFGKLTKPADFVGPEAQLQELLDERSN